MSDRSRTNSCRCSADQRRLAGHWLGAAQAHFAGGGPARQAGFTEHWLVVLRRGAVKIEEAEPSSRSPLTPTLRLCTLWKGECGRASLRRDHSEDDERPSSFLQFFEGASKATMD